MTTPSQSPSTTENHPSVNVEPDPSGPTVGDDLSGMAWIEQTGHQSWRVRDPRPGGGHGSQSGFTSRNAARDYADDLESDRRRGRWLDTDGAKTLVATWAAKWVETLDVEIRTEENYRAYLRNHILPRWGTTPLGVVTALDVTSWIKTLHQRYAASTVAGTVTVSP